MTILKPEDERSDVHRGNDINHIKDKLLSSLVDEGLVEVISDEMYRLTEEGKNIVWEVRFIYWKSVNPSEERGNLAISTGIV